MTEEQTTPRPAPDWSRISIGLYGLRKVGKTTTASKARAPFFLDCEDRLKGIAVPYEAKPYTPDVTAVERVIGQLEREVVTDPATGRPVFRKGFPYRTLCWDGFDPIYHRTLEDAAKGKVMAIGRKFEEGKNPAATNILAAHQFAADILGRLLYRFLALPAVHVITMHERTAEGEVVKDQSGKKVWDQDAGGWQKRKYTTPDLAPKMLQLLEDRLDVLAYCYSEVNTGRRLMVTYATNTTTRYISAFDCTGVIGYAPGRGGVLMPAPVLLDWETSIVAPLRTQAQAVTTPTTTAGDTPAH